VSGEELRSSIVQNSTSVFRFDDKYELEEEMVGLRCNWKYHISQPMTHLVNIDWAFLSAHKQKETKKKKKEEYRKKLQDENIMVCPIT